MVYSKINPLNLLLFILIAVLSSCGDLPNQKNLENYRNNNDEGENLDQGAETTFSAVGDFLEIDDSYVNENGDNYQVPLCAGSCKKSGDIVVCKSYAQTLSTQNFSLGHNNITPCFNFLVALESFLKHPAEYQEATADQVNGDRWIFDKGTFTPGSLSFPEVTDLDKATGFVKYVPKRCKTLLWDNRLSDPDGIHPDCVKTMGKFEIITVERNYSPKPDSDSSGTQFVFKGGVEDYTIKNSQILSTSSDSERACDVSIDSTSTSENKVPFRYSGKLSFVGSTVETFPENAKGILRKCGGMDNNVSPVLPVDSERNIFATVRDYGSLPSGLQTSSEQSALEDCEEIIKMNIMYSAGSLALLAGHPLILAGATLTLAVPTAMHYNSCTQEVLAGLLTKYSLLAPLKNEEGSSFALRFPVPSLQKIANEGGWNTKSYRDVVVKDYQISFGGKAVGVKGFETNQVKSVVAPRTRIPQSTETNFSLKFYPCGLVTTRKWMFAATLTLKEPILEATCMSCLYTTFVEAENPVKHSSYEIPMQPLVTSSGKVLSVPPYITQQMLLPCQIGTEPAQYLDLADGKTKELSLITSPVDGKPYGTLPLDQVKAMETSLNAYYQPERGVFSSVEIGCQQK